jgi:hypothetical protein
MLDLLQPDLMKLRAAFNTLEGEKFFDSEIRRLSDYSLLGAIVWINQEVFDDTNEDSYLISYSLLRRDHESN